MLQYNKYLGCNMTIAMNSATDYVKFFDIAADAYNSKKIDIYRQIMTTLLSSYKTLLYDIELINAELEQKESLDMDEVELDIFYESMYAMVDTIKLLKSHLSPLKDKDGLFFDLNDIVEKIYEHIIEHIDIISTQEVKEIQGRYLKAG